MTNYRTLREALETERGYWQRVIEAADSGEAVAEAAANIEAILKVLASLEGRDTLP